MVCSIAKTTSDGRTLHLQYQREPVPGFTKERWSPDGGNAALFQCRASAEKMRRNVLEFRNENVFIVEWEVA